ncbi:MAG: hypothetical protein ACKOLA_05705, partial [Spartobacteria bacterium]
AENPPKKYEDVYPLNFHNADWRALWDELRDVILFWCGHGVKIFRVDNPHNRPAHVFRVRRKIGRDSGRDLFA